MMGCGMRLEMDSGMGSGMGSRCLQISPDVSGCLGVWVCGKVGVWLGVCVCGWWVVCGWLARERERETQRERDRKRDSEIVRERRKLGGLWVGG